MQLGKAPLGSLQIAVEPLAGQRAIEIDAGLDPLRSRDDYKALITQIKAKGALSKKLEETAAKP